MLPREAEGCAVAATLSGRVLADQRQSVILHQLRREGAVRVRDLTSRFGVSDMTVRRDLDLLAEAGLLEKVRGGAVLIDRADHERAAVRHRHCARPPVQAIAGLAARLVPAGATIGLSAGVATLAMAAQLVASEPRSVVTNSIPVAEAVGIHAVEGGPQVLVSAGRRTTRGALVGPLADATWRAVSLDVAFVSAYGISAGAGLTLSDLEEAETIRTLISRASHTVLLAESSDWGRIGLVTAVSLADVDTVVSDRGLTEKDGALETLAELGVAVHLVDPDASLPSRRPA